MRPSVLFVSFFSSPGALPDDFYTLARGLAPRSELYLLTTDVLRGRDVPGVRDACYVSFSKRSPLSLLSPAPWLTVWRFARQRQFDLLLVHTEHPLHAAAAHIARASRTVFWCHDPLPHSGSRTPYVLAYEIAKRILIARADRVVVSCEALRRDLIRRYGTPAERVITCYLCTLESLVFADLVRAAPRDTDILFFGRLEPYKGLDVLLEAVRRLRRAGQRPRVVIAGPGSAPPAPDADLTVHHRYLGDRELAELVARSRVVVLPYRDATGTQAPQTAFAYGTPVVAAAVGCLPEYVGHEVAGLVVPPNDPARLADALDRLLRDPALWERLSAGARERARTVFSVERVVEMVLREAEEQVFTVAEGRSVP